MTTGTDKAKNPRFIKPPNVLKQKVGHGGIDPNLLEKSQHFIENIDIDFAPYAKNHLDQLVNAISAIKAGKFSVEEAREKLTAPIMQLKANGGMFRYQLISDVADIALQFIERVGEINEDCIDVLMAHEKTINIIVQNKLTGDGGREGYALVKELDQACKRYFSRHKSDS